MAKWEDAPLAPSWSTAPLVEDTLPPPLDFTRPDDDIRKSIAAMPADKQKAAHDAWADARVAKTPQLSVPSPARGIPIIGSLLDEATGGIQAGLHTISGGAIGAPYDEAVAEERARARAARKAAPIETGLGEFAAGVVTGAPIFSKLSKAKTLPGKMAEGASYGGVLSWLHGLASEGSAEERFKTAGEHFGPGALIGGLTPPALQGIGKGVAAAADALSPQIARAGAHLESLRNKLAIKASADGGGPPSGNVGADAAADQIIANQLARANVSVPQLRQRLAEADDAARLDSNSRAQNVLAPVDLDPSLQRLAGSVARQQPEADNIGKAFQYARQTGQPSGLELPPSANIPTRPPLAKPQSDDPPMGQFERVQDALKRALRIEDDALHGHGKSAFATEQRIVSRAREEGNKLYGKAYEAADGLDIRPNVSPVLEKWTAAAADEPPAVAYAIRSFLRQYVPQSGVVSDLRRFQKAKEFSDGIIRKWMESPESRNRYVASRLTEIQHELLAAVDGIKTNGVGNLYKSARDTFAGEMQLKDALKLGRDLIREDSEVAVDQFKQLATEGERKAARLGLWEGFKQLGARKSRTDDVTRIFSSPRVQEIIESVVPRPKGANAEFANRPERFGQYVANEQKMISTRNQTMGNSKTAERLADDEALNNMQSLIEAAKKSGSSSPTGFIVNIMEATLSRLFGFRADTAASIARRLYSANPMEREILLQNIERRMGPGRAAAFARIVSDISSSAAPISGAAYGNPSN